MARSCILGGRVPFMIVDGEVELYTGKLDDQKGGEGEEGS
jgi:hypothetical protein